MPLSEAEKWLDHLGSCSPCYADFKQIQEAFERQRRQRWLAAAAAILLAVGIGGWALLHKRNENLITQTAVLDLRDRSPARGTETNPGDATLRISRRVSGLTILLPLGSNEGPYGLRIADNDHHPRFENNGTAVIKDGVTSLSVPINLTFSKPGLYFLELRGPGSEWSSYPLRIQ